MTVIAIDGPAGSGKSTIARSLAKRLGVAHIDTGATYRAATLAALRAGVDLDDEAAVLAVVSTAGIARVGDRTTLDGEDVEDEVRGSLVTASVSHVARHPRVRAHLLVLQQAMVPAAGAVVEGRDAATAVVPGADLKVWLTADPTTRAQRRAAQLDTGDVDSHEAQLRRRDALDAEQMAMAPDAVQVDTTGRDVGSLVAELAAMAGNPSETL